jgi:hypothetical protein
MKRLNPVVAIGAPALTGCASTEAVVSAIGAVGLRTPGR